MTVVVSWAVWDTINYSALTPFPVAELLWEASGDELFLSLSL